MSTSPGGYSRRVPLAISLTIGGALFGAVTSVCNHGLGSRALSLIIGNDWAWLTAGLLACWTGRKTWKASFRNGFTFLLSAVLFYYLGDAMQGTYDLLDGSLAWPQVILDAIPWIIISGLTACGLSWLATLASRRDAAGVGASLVLPVYITYTACRRVMGQVIPDPDMKRVATFIAVVGGLICIALFVRGVHIILSSRSNQN